MTEPINVVCVKHGSLYSAEYVNKLYRGVARNTTLPFQFKCFTEDPSGIIPEVKTYPFVYDLPGWWNKVYLFSNLASLAGRVFYLDLDTVITGNIDVHMEFSGTFAVLRDFYFFRNHRLRNSFGSGLMAWDGGWGEHVWKEFLKDPQGNQKGHGHGDQGWLMHQIKLQEVTFWQDYVLERNRVDSYKVHVKDNQGILNPNTSIVCFHGSPRPHEIKGLDWMVEHWR